MRPLTKRKRRAQERGPVTVTCELCPFTVTASTWRPAKRQTAIHRDRFHRSAAAA